MNPRNLFPLLALSAALLSACGGGSGGGGGSLSAGGIGGTSSGTVTAVSRTPARALSAGATLSSGATTVTVNDTQSFTTSSGTEVDIDDKSDDVSNDGQVSDLQPGMTVDVELGDDANDTFTRGSLRRIHIESAVRGIVGHDADGTLTVLGQKVAITDTTRYFDRETASTSTFIPANGDVIEVHGQRDDIGVISATLIEKRAANSNAVWKVTGTVSNYAASPGSLDIHDVHITFTGNALKGCQRELVDNSLNDARVKVLIEPDPVATEYVAKAVICKRGARVPDSVSTGTVRAAYAGIIDAALDTNLFSVQGQQVRINDTTEFEAGTTADLTLGARVEVRGQLTVTDGVPGELLAKEIRVLETRFRLAGNATVTKSGEEFSLMGLSVTKSSRTQDFAGMFDAASAKDVVVEGYVDTSGRNVALIVGNDSLARNEIRAVVSNVTSPLITVLKQGTSTGITINTTGAEFGIGHRPQPRPRPPKPSFRGQDDHEDDYKSSVNVSLSTIKEGDVIRVVGGAYDVGTSMLKEDALHNNMVISVERLEPEDD